MRSLFRMTDKKAKQWGKRRQAGQLKYVLGFGLFKTGLPAGVLHFIVTETESVTKLSSERFIINLILFSVFGVLVGLMYWYLHEKSYKNTIDKF